MTKISVTEEVLRATDDYLKGYGLCEKMLKLDKYERTYFAYNESEKEYISNDSALCRARMFEIRHFIMSMKNCDEKLMLYYHYVRGEPVERCAELLGISRSSGFRLKRRALALAAKALENKGLADSE
jgi:hypothetical protein